MDCGTERKQMDKGLYREKPWKMKKLGGLTSLDVKKEREIKKWGSRERFVKIVDQNSLQK